MGLGTRRLAILNERSARAHIGEGVPLLWGTWVPVWNLGAMPVERRSGTSQTTAILIGVVSVVVCVALVWWLINLASGGGGPVSLNLGDDEFNAGQTKRLTKQIGEEGPVLFSDVSGRGQVRPIWVNHFGDDPAREWYVFSAIAPEADANCFLAWNDGETLFDQRTPNEDDPAEPGAICAPEVYSATGTAESGPDPEAYNWSVDDDGNLVIDFRAE
jgi:hypothetical protein